jgi:MinD-like ATPase involved in chromosome partitioning or flagellar assembly
MRTSVDFQVFSARDGKARRHPKMLLPFSEELWNRVLTTSALSHLGHPRRVAVAGVHEGDGSSTIAAALCYYLARGLSLQVCLVEVDLRSPWLQRAGLAPVGSLGLRGVVKGQCEPTEVIVRVEPLGFHVLPAGEPLINPTSLLSEESVAELYQKLGNLFDVLVFDSPALNAAPENRVVVAAAESTIVVLKSGRTLPEQAAYWLGKVSEYGGTVGAVCLNGVRSGLPSFLRSLF